MNEVEEIKNRLNIADVISEYIQLTPAGANLKARCPFHNEKTPSFMVSPDKQIWHCFGCSAGGDVFTFVQKMEGIEFREALKLLADKAGVRLEARQPQEEAGRNRLWQLCAWAARFYHQALLRSREGKIAREYLARRKVGQKSIFDFQLGYSPLSWSLTSDFFKKKGFSEQEIVLAGLAVQKTQYKSYDRFRGRLMFPIKNVHGQVVGFGARVLDEKRDQLGKYINSPQTPIYDKSNILYALDAAKQEIKKQNLCIVVEGYLDVITAHAAGTGNVIGVSGTALTPGQLNLVKRYAKNIALCFDADSAGTEAAKRGIETAVAAGLSVHIIVLPKGEDPDSLIKKNARLWQEAIKTARRVMDFYFASSLQNYDPKNVEGKKSIAAELLPLLKRIPDPIEQAHYLQRLGEILEIDEQVLRLAIEKIVPENRQDRDAAPAMPQGEIAPLSTAEVLARRILGLGLKYPQYLEQILQKIAVLSLPPGWQDIYKELKKYYNKTNLFDLVGFKRKIKALSPSDVTRIDVAILDIEKDFAEDDDDVVIAHEVSDSLERLQKHFLQAQLKVVERQIKVAEKAGDKSALQGLMQQFSLLAQKFRKPTI